MLTLDGLLDDSLLHLHDAIVESLFNLFADLFGDVFTDSVVVVGDWRAVVVFVAVVVVVGVGVGVGAASEKRKVRRRSK